MCKLFSTTFTSCFHCHGVPVASIEQVLDDSTENPSRHLVRSDEVFSAPPLSPQVPEGAQRVQAAAAGAGRRAEECGQPDEILPDPAGPPEEDKRLQRYLPHLVKGHGHTHTQPDFISAR